MTDHTPVHRYEPPEGMFMMTAEQAAVFNEPTRTDIMVLLADRPATTKQLAEALGKPEKGTVGYHLTALHDADLISVVRTRQVRAITEKYYGRRARTYVFPSLEEHDPDDDGFIGDMLQEARPPQGDEAGTFTLRHARIPDERAAEFALEIVRIAEEFAAKERGGTTVYGFIAGIYPTDRPSLKEDEE